MEFSQFGITEQEIKKFKSTPTLLNQEEYEKFNSWYARKIGTCSCVKTPIQTIKQYFDSL